MADLLATTDQLQLLMRDTGLSDELATLLLELATGEVQALAGQRLVEVEDDPFEIEVYGGNVVELKQRPVTALSTVTLDGTALTEGVDYRRAAGSARVHLSCGQRRLWPSFLAGVYTHGYAADAQELVPAQAATLGLARQIELPVGVQSKSIDDYRVQWAEQLASAAAEATNLRMHLQRVYGGGVRGVQVLA